MFNILNVTKLWRTSFFPRNSGPAPVGPGGPARPHGFLRDIVLVCAADAIVGVSFGVTAVAGGLPAWVPVAMSVLVFAGGAQVASASVLVAGGGPVAAVAAGVLLNTRFLPYGFAVADVTGGSWLTRLLGAHLTTDETIAFAVRETVPERRRAAFWTCGVLLFASWNAAVVLGVVAGAVIRNTGSFGLDSTFPAVLLALALPSMTERRTRAAAIVGAAVAVALTPVLPAGLPVLAGLCGLAFALPGREGSCSC
jgi:4-azaleucine resistance transporter AzlC